MKNTLIIVVPLCLAALFWKYQLKPQLSNHELKSSALTPLYLYNDEMLTDDWYSRNNIRSEIKLNVRTRNFNQLERMVNEARSNKYQFSTSISVLVDLYNGIPYAMHDFPEIHAFIDEWKKHSPNSNIPDIIAARAYRAEAQKARGGAYISNTSSAQLKTYKSLLGQAWEAITRAEDTGPMDAELCNTKVYLHFALNADKETALDAFEKCTELDPGYVHLYETASMFLRSIWFGSDRELVQFIERAANDTRSIYGDGLYALLVYQHTFYTGKMFEEFGGDFSWERTHRGFHDLFRKLGKSSYTLHAYAYCAMLAEDYVVLAEILGEIGTAWDEEKQQYFKKKAWYNYHLNHAQVLL